MRRRVTGLYTEKAEKRTERDGYVCVFRWMLPVYAQRGIYRGEKRGLNKRKKKK